MTHTKHRKEENMDLVYKNIKNRRKELGMTQQELANKSGYSDRSMIARIERGDVDLTITKLVDIADALKISPSALLGWKNNDASPNIHGEEPTPTNTMSQEQADRLTRYATLMRDIIRDEVEKFKSENT
jgi:transcriptional regulator with XRE-family HTH domain